MKLTTSNEKQFYKPYINDIYIIHIYLHSKHLYITYAQIIEPNILYINN